MIETIVVPTDGSDHANKAVALASDLAAKYGARVVFVHVLLTAAEPAGLRALIDVAKLAEPARAELDRIGDMYRAASEANRLVSIVFPVSGEVLEAVGNVLLDEAESIARDHQAKDVHRTLKQGDPTKCILSAADEENADMIVMGSRGLSDVKGLLVGSVSHKVSHLAECTCVTVK